MHIVSISNSCFSYAKVSDALQVNSCNDPKIDGIMWSYKSKKSTTIFIFMNESFYEFDVETERVDKQRKINDVWPEVETPISGATAMKALINGTKMNSTIFYEEEILFFKDPKYWVYPSKKEYTSEQKLIRSGVFKFYLEHENIKHTTLSIFINPQNLHACGSLEEKNSKGEYELIVGDPRKIDENLVQFNVGECENFVDLYGNVLSLAFRISRQIMSAVKTNETHFFLKTKQIDGNKLLQVKNSIY
ncbi:hypothetical protein B4U79_18709 [Dinothrombium tinctorium]|uniref:Uncharacterized protein n=1 Tax=Dinothrombium tinctorium TaxID=1965070 RepID=A0A3S3RFJ7_9ACAR|nr:hypothetical protein B4U79_18709 [Dinothrombium tinctorium]